MAGIDGGGTPIWYYQGKLFTGVILDYEKTGELSLEIDCENGYEDGWCRLYHNNGRLHQEYKMLKKVIQEETSNEWDENGVPVPR